MELYEYIHLPINIIPKEIIDQYDFRVTEKYCHVYEENTKECMGSPMWA